MCERTDIAFGSGPAEALGFAGWEVVDLFDSQEKNFAKWAL